MNKKTSWNLWVFEKAEKIIKTATTPLSFKELAWRAINFTVACGKSNPLSFAVRPIADHRRLRLIVGLSLVIFVMVAAFFAPLPSLASDTGGASTIAVLPEGEVKLTTEEAVKWPISSREISQGFWLLHAGIDIRTPVGTPVNPVMRGVVKETEVSRFGYGEKIVIAHQEGYETLYAHLSKINVLVGDEVTTESVIGLSGSTGRSTGPHLHLEIHSDGKPINPLLILGNK